MIQLTPQMKVFAHTGITDFRCGIDGLCAVVKSQFNKDPMSGAAFVFSNRRRQSMKLLVYDGQGYWCCQKRLSAGRFKHWPSGSSLCEELLSRELSILLFNGNPKSATMQEDWKVIEYRHSDE